MIIKKFTFDIVTACRLKDLNTLRLALPRLEEFLPHRRLVVFTARKNIPEFITRLGAKIECIDEDTVFPDMKLKNLREKIKLPGFPHGAGWYFQQFLKLSYPQIRPDIDRYLIWDADTVPLRRFSVFEPDGRALLTPATLEAAKPPFGVSLDPETARKMRQATKPHQPYSENYKIFFGEKIIDKRSFIAQQMPIHAPTLRALIRAIEKRFPGKESWAWKIIKNLQGTGVNLFSEYEFYAHFALKNAPEFHKIRPLSWSRAGRLTIGCTPETMFSQWSKQFDYVALERWASPWHRRMIQIFHLLPQSLRLRIREIH
jgi:hypothetical protein